MLQYGPILAFVDGSDIVFEQYGEGIIDTLDCGTEPNHAVLIVGFGRDPSGLDYFVIQNSYGSSWGQQGLAKIAAQSEGKGFCGL